MKCWIVGTFKENILRQAMKEDKLVKYIEPQGGIFDSLEDAVKAAARLAHREDITVTIFEAVQDVEAGVLPHKETKL